MTLLTTDEPPARPGRRTRATWVTALIGVGRGATDRMRDSWGIDLLTVLVGLVALTVYVLHGFEGALSRDLGIYAYGGQQLLEGVPPYVSVLNRAGPLAHVIPAVGALGARAADIGDLLGMRLLYLGFAVASVCAVHVLGRTLFASRLAGLATAGAFLSFSGFIEYATYGPREKTPMVFFLLVALLAVSKQRWFVAGFFVSLATLTWQPAFAAGATAMAVGLLAVRAGARIRAVVRIAVGGLVPLSVCTLYFAVAGASAQFVQAFVLINVQYGEASPLLARAQRNLAELVAGYGVTLWVIAVGLVALTALALLRVRDAVRHRDVLDVSFVAFGASGVVGLVWTFRAFDGWPDIFVLLPLAALGVGALAAQIVERTPAVVGSSIVLAWVLATVAGATTYSVAERTHALNDQRASVRAVFGQLPRNATLLSVKAPQTLVLSGRRNPSRHQMIMGPLARYMSEAWPGGLRGYGDFVARREPTLLAFPGRVPWWLEDTLRTEYRRVGAAPGWSWYAHVSLGRDVLSSVRRAAHEAWESQPSA